MIDVARIGHGVHRMAEADHDFLVGHAPADVRLGFVGRVVALLDFERHFVGAAVFRAAQRADGAGDAGIDVRAGAGDHARRERGGVELVLGVQIERGVHGAHPVRRRRRGDAAGAGSARPRSRRRSRRGCGGCCARSDTSSRASSRNWPPGDRRSRARPAASWSLASGSTQPSADAPVRMTSMGCVAGGSCSSMARTGAGNAAQVLELGLVGGELAPCSAACRGSADRRSLRTRRSRPLRGCRSRGNAGRCRCGRRCTARCCRR